MAPRKVKGWPPAILTPVPPADIRRGDGPLVTEFVEALCNSIQSGLEPSGRITEVEFALLASFIVICECNVQAKKRATFIERNLIIKNI